MGAEAVTSRDAEAQKAAVADYRYPVGAGEGNRTLVVSLEGFCSTIELHPRCFSSEARIQPHPPNTRGPPALASALGSRHLVPSPRAYRPAAFHTPLERLVEGEGFEPSKAWPADLQSAPFDRSGTPPNETRNFGEKGSECQTVQTRICFLVCAPAEAIQRSRSTPPGWETVMIASWRQVRNTRYARPNSRSACVTRARCQAAAAMRWRAQMNVTAQRLRPARSQPARRAAVRPHPRRCGHGAQPRRRPPPEGWTRHRSPAAAG